jgi:acetamidase/formamidase
MGWPRLFAAGWAFLCLSCGASELPVDEPPPDWSVDFTVETDRTHSRFSRTIEPVLRVPSGIVLEVFTHEATGGQFELGSTAEDLEQIDMDRVHTLTGPVYVEGAGPGDVLAVDLLEIEPAAWGWMAVMPGFGLLAEDFPTTAILRTFSLDVDRGTVDFAEGIRIPLRPFAGVMGVAPDTD